MKKDTETNFRRPRPLCSGGMRKEVGFDFIRQLCETFIKSEIVGTTYGGGTLCLSISI